MGTRPGALDPGVVLYLFQNLGLTAKEVETILYKKSGLLGISGISNDMRDLLGSSEPAARLAVDYFVYRAAKEIGALAAVLGGIDGLVFTAGIGENSAEIRAADLRSLRLARHRARRGGERARAARGSPAQDSRVSAWVIPTNEELMIARHTGRLLGLVESPQPGQRHRKEILMAATAPQETRTTARTSAWQGFRTGLWQKEINVRDFIQQNYEPYDGDESFLAPATAAHAEDLEQAQGPLRRGAQEGRARRLADSELDHGACARLHRPRERDHRRPADRRAAQARDHAERRLPDGR